MRMYSDCNRYFITFYLLICYFFRCYDRKTASGEGSEQPGEWMTACKGNSLLSTSSTREYMY